MSESKKWYRIGFRESTPLVEVVLELGQGKQGDMTLRFLAPLDEEGGTVMTSMRSVETNAEGYPNGYYPTEESAVEGVTNHLNAQLGKMTEARDAVMNLLEETIVDPNLN